MKILLFHALIIIITIISHSSSEITNIRITNDPRPLILFDRFRFSKHGQVVVYVENVSYKLPSLKTYTPLDPSQMAFFLLKDDDLFFFFFNAYQICTASTRYAEPIFRFNDLAIDSTYNATIAISEPNKYNLVFRNCQARFYTVSMTVATEMYNLQNGEKNFLPAGQIRLPELYFVFFSIYVVVLATWTYICMQKKPNLDQIHYVTCALLIFKVLKLLCDAVDKMYIAKTGKPYDVAFYVSGFFKLASVFTGIVLISAVWSIVKPFLDGRERKVLEIAIPIQVIENVAYFVVEETGPATGSDDVQWGRVLLSVDIVCCMAVMVTIVRSIRDLKDAGDGRVEKLCMFMKLYIVVVGYLYFTRVGVAALGDHMFEWIGVGVTEVATLGFYGFLVWKLSSVEKINSYFRINDDYVAANQIEIAQVLRRSELEVDGNDDDIFEL